jgi:hypothetical protein
MLALLEQRRGDPTEAETRAREALTCYLELARANPRTFEPLVQQTTQLLVKIALDQ